MSKTVKRITIGAIALVCVGALAWPKLNKGGMDAPAAPARGTMTMTATGYVVQPSVLAERVLATGTLRANEEVSLASETSGKITQILFREGTRVEKGQLLLKINDAPLLAESERVMYRIRLAEQQVERQKALLDKGGISQEEFDLTNNQLNVLQAELAINEAELARTEIRAPFDGVLGLRHVSEGGYITPQSRIASLQDVSPVKVDFSLPEKFSGLVKLGSPIRFSVSGNPQSYLGTVYAVEPRIDENTRTLHVRATSPNPNGILLPGAFADIELILQEHGDALSIPTIAIIPELGGKKIFLVKNGIAQEVSVETGIRTDSTVQVISGIAPGDTVLTSALQTIRTGMPVNVAL